MPGLPGDDRVEPAAGRVPRELVLDRIDRMDSQAAALRETAGTGTVVDNLTAALTAVFESVAVAMVGLVAARDELRARLRRTLPAGVPVLTEAAIMIGEYLTEERARSRIADDADVEAIAPTLIGACHLRYAGQDGPVQAAAVRRIVISVRAGALPPAT